MKAIFPKSYTTVKTPPVSVKYPGPPARLVLPTPQRNLLERRPFVPPPAMAAPPRTPLMTRYGNVPFRPMPGMAVPPRVNVNRYYMEPFHISPAMARYGLSGMDGESMEEVVNRLATKAAERIQAEKAMSGFGGESLDTVAARTAAITSPESSQPSGGFGFLQFLSPIIGAVGNVVGQYQAQKDAENRAKLAAAATAQQRALLEAQMRAAEEQQKRELELITARERAAAAEAAAQAAQAPGMPKWAIPAAAGIGVLLLAGVWAWSRR